MSEEIKTIYLPHAVTIEEEKKLEFKFSIEGYKLEAKIVDYVKKQSLYKLRKLENKTL